MYQTQKPGADEHATFLSSLCIWAKPNNFILKATQELLSAYWKRYNYMIDYFLLHQFMTIVMKDFPEEKNAYLHILMKIHIFSFIFLIIMRNQDWKRQSCLHKLSYKLEKKDMEKDVTFFDV